MESYVFIDGKKYRRGYTTGTTATAAAMAATYLALGDDALSVVSVQLPNGNLLDISVHYDVTEMIEDTPPQSFQAYAFKDGGDDIDQTNGLQIIAKVEITNDGLIEIRGGKGVGMVTKPGLQIPVGEWAINPVPRQMIRDNLKKILGPTLGAKVEISIPRGEEVALKTFNPKLGIVGGISVIGTTGIVEPMSEEAWKKSLEIELRQLKLKGSKRVVLVPGNHGEKFAVKQLKVNPEEVVTMSNFVGYMLMEAKREGFEKAVLVGHLGKLIKVSAGIFHTHSRVADGRADILCSYLAKMRAPYDLIEATRMTNTTDEAVDLLIETPYKGVFDLLAKAAAERATDHSYGALRTEVFLYDMKGRLLGASTTAEEAFSND